MGFPYMLGGPSGATSGWDDGPSRPEGVGQQQTQQRPQNAPKGQIRIPVFRGGQEGYGDSRVLPQKRQNSYNRTSYNADMRWPGEMREFFINPLPVGVFHNNAPIYITEWEDTVPNPLILYVADNKIMKIQAGAVTTDTTLAAVATGATMHDNGSGVPYLYVAEGGVPGAAKVQRRDRTGAITIATNLYADKLLSLAGNLYITAASSTGPTNGITNGIGVVTVGTDPNVAAQPALTVIGNPGRKINNITAVRYAPVCLKQDGSCADDRLSDTWLNHANWMKDLPHPDNGKVYWYEGTDVCIALGMGGAVRFNGFVAIPYDLLPLEDTTPDLDTTTQLIAAGGTARHWGALVTQIGAKRQRNGGAGDPTQPTGLGAGSTPNVAKSTDAGATFTSYGSQAFDGDPTTFADLSALPGAGSGQVYFVHSQPFQGVKLSVLAANANAATWTAAVWNGTTWVNIGVVDLTLITGNTVTLGRTGWMMIASDPVAAVGWKRGGIGVLGATQYQLRLTVSAALSASVQVNAVDFLPWRPSLDPVNFSVDGMDRAGMYPHLLFSRTQGDGAHVVHDMGRLQNADEVGAVIYAAVGGASLNDDRQIVICGKNYVTWTSMSLDDRPAAFGWPVNSINVLVERPGIDLGVVARLNAVELDGFDFRRQGFLYYRFEDGRPWTLAGEFRSLPARIEVPSSDRVGDVIRFAVGWKAGADGGAMPMSPRITRVDAFVTPCPGLVAPRLVRNTPAPVV